MKNVSGAAAVQIKRTLFDDRMLEELLKRLPVWKIKGIVVPSLILVVTIRKRLDGRNNAIFSRRMMLEYVVWAVYRQQRQTNVMG
ncbi:hypothetical protein [Paenibacillus beijingensis]|uniref:Uncharacterized protein n=1 Tax=Paenibacillus beijingensis TaxID=1126833 RepID=A0A0D5NP73_9BACL|nr:hypothetical protein [Paenibacillus beijingensis]AJY76698.1 hypothetical protein VN24_21645 [Paenibacillus beijingensis]